MKVFTHLFLGLFLLSVSLAYAKEAIITADKLNVRHAPNGKKIDNLKQNKSVLIIETKDDWSHIAYDGKRGWVSSAYLTLKDPSSQQKQTPIIPKLESDDLRTHCKTEPLSNAKVCMKVSPASLVCLGSTCEIIFTYNVSTSYTGKGFLYVDLDFRAELLFPDGSVQERLEQTGHSFFKEKNLNDTIRIPFTIQRGVSINGLKMQNTRANITKVSYYR